MYNGSQFNEEKKNMKFKKYSSLTNHYHTDFIQSTIDQYSDRLWYATEKIHGANFSFWCDGVDVKIARRTAFIEEDESFYECWSVFEKYKDKILALCKYMQDDESDLLSIAVYGELYGSGIQSGVDYIDTKDFMCFDIVMHYADQTEATLSFDLVEISCDTFDIPVVPVIGKGRLIDMLNLDNDLITTINPKDGNTAEGLVIRPNVNIVDSRGSRVIIKSKNSKWSENKPRKVKKVVQFSEQDQAVFDLMCTYINENRLNNVLSKEQTDNVPRIIGLLTQDALAEFKNDGHTIDDDQWKVIKRRIGNESGAVVRKKLFGG